MTAGNKTYIYVRYFILCHCGPNVGLGKKLWDITTMNSWGSVRQDNDLTTIRSICHR